MSGGHVYPITTPPRRTCLVGSSPSYYTTEMTTRLGRVIIMTGLSYSSPLGQYDLFMCSLGCIHKKIKLSDLSPQSHRLFLSLPYSIFDILMFIAFSLTYLVHVICTDVPFVWGRCFVLQVQVEVLIVSCSRSSTSAET